MDCNLDQQVKDFKVWPELMTYPDNADVAFVETQPPAGGYKYTAGRNVWYQLYSQKPQTPFVQVLVIAV